MVPKVSSDAGTEQKIDGSEVSRLEVTKVSCGAQKLSFEIPAGFAKFERTSTITGQPVFAARVEPGVTLSLAFGPIPARLSLMCPAGIIATDTLAFHRSGNDGLRGKTRVRRVLVMHVRHSATTSPARSSNRPPSFMFITIRSMW